MIASKLTSTFGVTVSMISALMMFALIIQRVLSINLLGYSPNDVPGYTSIIISIFFVSGVQLFALGIIGEYISRIFLETKKSLIS